MSMFTAINTLVDDPSLPVVPPKNVRPFTGYEEGAFGHWMLGGSAVCLESASNDGDQDLTPVGAAPIYPGAFTRLTNVNQRGLRSALADGVNAVDTLCCVVKVPMPDAHIHIPMGAFNSSVGGGGAVYLAAESGLTRALLASYRASAGSVFANVPTGLVVNCGDWIFLAVARKFTGGTRVVQAFVGGQAAPAALSAVTVYLPSAQPIGIGRAGTFNSAEGGTTDIAEFIAFSSQKTVSELQAIYARTKVRMKARGIAVV